MRGILPVALVGLGIYLLRGHVFKSKKIGRNQVSTGNGAASFVTSPAEHQFKRDDYDSHSDFETETRARSWRNR